MKVEQDVMAYGVEKDSPSDVQIPWMRVLFIMQSGRRMEQFFV